MPKIIHDEFSHLPISPQLRYQRRRNAIGRCRICGGAGSPYCEQHKKMQASYKKGRMPFSPKKIAAIDEVI